MWIKEPGKINDNLEFLGTFANCLYLLRGGDLMMVGGGIASVAPVVDQQLSKMHFEPERLKYLVILHSHFDHCGAVPYLKRKFPHIQILASAHAAEVLSKDKVIESIRKYNQDMIDKLGLHNEYDKLNLRFDGISVDRIVKDSDVIDLSGGIQARIVEAPGHTKCSIAVYVPGLKVLFPSDSMPLPFDYRGHRHYFMSPQYSFTAYKESLRKLADYEADICAFEHQGAVMGEDARKILGQGLEEAEKYQDTIVNMFARISDLDTLSEQYSEESMQKYKLDFLDRETIKAITRVEIRSVLRDAGLVE